MFRSPLNTTAFHFDQIVLIISVISVSRVGLLLRRLMAHPMASRRVRHWDRPNFEFFVHSLITLHLLLTRSHSHCVTSFFTTLISTNGPQQLLMECRDISLVSNVKMMCSERLDQVFTSLFKACCCFFVIFVS